MSGEEGMTEKQRYPLCWPSDVPRTPSYRRYRNHRFKVSEAIARDDLIESTRALGGKNIILSTNVKLRLDGHPYANQSRLEDPGVALYFTRKKQELVLACDRWDNLRDNYRSIGLTLEGLRAIERAGCTDLLERAFTGYSALPSAIVTQRHWTAVLGLHENATWEQIRSVYRNMAKLRHPDVPGGNHVAFQELEAAYRQAMKEKGPIR